MSTAALQQVLDAVRRHLWRSRLAVAARQAAWGSALVMLTGLLLHLLVRPLTFGGLVIAALVPWLLALVQAVITRPRPIERAAWADRYLGGRSAYATALEHDKDAPSARPSARTRLDEWIAGAAPHSLALLAARPRELRLREPIVTAVVCSVLAAGLLQLPTRPIAGAATATGVASIRASAATAASSEVPAGNAPPTPTASGRPDGRLESLASDRGAAGAAESTSPAAIESEDNAAVRRDIAANGTATVAAGSGRDAGSSRDVGTDGTPTAAWTGALAARLRAVTSGKEPASTTADADRAVEYLAADAAQDQSSATSGSVLAAAPPAARDELRVGPAERAYLRAYWATNGARP
jgi:hypothetical protein